MRIVYLADGTFAYNGINQDAHNTPVIWMGENETRKLEIDWSILGTVDTASASGDDVTVASATSTNTQTVTISAPGYSGLITLTMTTTAGETFKKEVIVNRRGSNRTTDYN